MEDITYLIFATALIVFFILFTFQQLSVIARKDRVVLVSSNAKHVRGPLLEAIRKYVRKSEEMNFIEIGAGYSKITTIAATKFRWKSIIAVELDFFAIFISRVKNRFNKLPISFVRLNVFNYPIPRKSVVYSYMSVSVMNKLLKQGAFDSCLVLSLTFAFDGVEPIAVYEVKGFQKRLYVYDFR